MHPTCPLTTCLSLLLLVHPTAAHLHSRLRSPSSHDIDLHQIALSTSAATITYPSLLLRPAASLYAAIAPDPALCSPATPCALLVEAWYDGHLYSEQRPTPILLASYNAKPVVSPQRNLRPRQRWLRQFLQRPPNKPLIPAVRQQRHAPVIVDREALATARPYQYILLRNVTTALWKIRLFNSNDTQSNPMNATFRVTLEPPPIHPNATSGESLCPRGRSTHVCSGHGHCRRAACVCDEPYAGRYCEHRVHPLSSTSFEVQSEHMQYFKYIVPRSGNIAVNMQFYLSSPLASFAQPILFVKLPYENGGKALREGPPLPTIYDIRFTDPNALLSSAPPLQRIVRSNLRQGDTLYIAVYNHPRPPYAWYLHRHPDFARLLPGHYPVLVRLEAYPCFSNLRRTFQSSSDSSQVIEKCPTESIQVAWQLNWRFFIVPLLLGSFTLLSMIVCVSVWASVFRQHIFEVIHGYSPDEISGTFTRRDKLSEAEVNAMFPAFVFTKVETAALGATGDVCCSVCLCSFEEGELLRRLACGHSYHSYCLDQWLLTNATCPRCRKSARIRGEGLRSSWWSRRPYIIFRSLLTRTGLAAWAERFRGRFEAGFMFGGEGMLDSSDYSRRYGHST